MDLARVGYLVMVVGLALVKWPLFFRDGGLAALPVFEGVVATILTAMSLLAIVGLWHPLRMLPLLVLESLWKLVWLAVVGVPRVLAGDLDEQLTATLSSVTFVVIILAVTPGTTCGGSTCGAPAHRGGHRATTRGRRCRRRVADGSRRGSPAAC